MVSSDPSHPHHEEAKRAVWDESGDVLVKGSVRLTELIALMQHYQPDGCLAVVLWYVAVADSGDFQEGQWKGDGEGEHEARWAGYEKAEGLMGNAEYACLCFLPTFL